MTMDQVAGNEQGFVTRAFDLLASQTRLDADAQWAELRALSPIVLHEATEHQREFWTVTRYDEVCEVFRNWELFSSARTDPARSSVAFNEGPVPLLVPEELDPPVWFGYRRILAELLTPAAAESLRPHIRHWCDHYLDQIIERGHGNFVHDLTVPVPAAVTMEWLGFPEEEWLPYASVFHDTSAHPPGHPAREAALLRYADIMSAITREIGIRRAEPRDDPLTAMVKAEIDGAPIDQYMLECLVFMVLGGGVDTTTSLTTSALVHLGLHPEDRDRLRADPSAITLATEEFLRFYPPSRIHARTVTEDTEVLGCPMRAGDRVVLGEISANYDERQFPEPERFVLDREPNRHVSFGMGRHRCPGSHLARVELAEMLDAVLRRMPDYEIVEDGLEEYPSWVGIGGWSEAPFTFAPGPRLR
jgi:cytochrome P450